MTNLSITAPAKINLFLHVVGQRSDGYHLLQSVFQLIDLSDEVILSRREDGDIVRQNPLPNISLPIAHRAGWICLSQSATAPQKGQTGCSATGRPAHPK